MTNLWAIIPVKPLANAKSRLAAALSPDERRKLAEEMLRRIVGVTTSVPQISGTLVISRDSKALAIARDLGVRTVMESGQPELNAALMRATAQVLRWKGGGVLILPADLPLVTKDDLQAMIALGRELFSVVIATDRNQDGTNAMLVRPPGLFEYAYGPGSYTRHLERAHAAKATVEVYQSERLMLDIDLPEDLAHYERLINGGDGSANSRHELAG